MLKHVQILDCTLRDGGLGLEDGAKSDPSELGFPEGMVEKIIHQISGSHIDIVELGSIEISQEDKRRFAIYQNVEAVSETIPKTREPGPCYAALFRGPDTPLEDIPQWREGLCPMLRVIIRYSELQKSLDFCAGLAKKGYKVFVQPMLTMRYTEEELDLLIQASNEMGAYALYFVDSYGYMQNEDIDRFFQRFDAGLNPEIRIGFHSHNNMNLAYSNVLHLLNRESQRQVIVDACATGMGQGAGNLQTELIANHLNQTLGRNYAIEAVLDVCETVDSLTHVGKWGYSVVRMIPAICKTAYKYALSMRNQYGLAYSEIYRILKDIPEDLRQRYTPENTKALLAEKRESQG